MKHCIRCVMPDTRPDLALDAEGVCNACRAYENRKQVDWDARKAELKAITDRYKGKSNWDCIVPVSGGKDSTYQVVRMLELGLKPLCVTARTCDLTDIGKENIENLINLGVDHIHFSPNPHVRTKMNKVGLEVLGDISWPEHVGIFTIPIQVAVKYRVPLIVWGENSQNEYGGPAAASENSVLNRQWLEEFGGLLGMRVSDLKELYNLTDADLLPYVYPTDAELADVGVTGVFLGHYLPWDGYQNSLIAQGNGFKCYEKLVEGSIVSYENLDNYQTGIHDYFKYLKFGFGRATDIASLHVRRGRLSREDAVRLVVKHDGAYPHSYLGKTLEDILKPMGMTKEQFDKICKSFTNKKIFTNGMVHPLA